MQKSNKSCWKIGLPLACLGAVLALFGANSRAETPEEFARHFARFKFEFHAEVQPPEVFLATKKGDCDDFATLADSELRNAGYKTHLFTVRMPGDTHVICYVEETKSYLDYNYRAAAHPLIPSDGVPTHIAAQVAASFAKPWLAVYEFNFHAGIKRLASHIIPNQKYLATLAQQPHSTAAGGQKH